MTRSRPITFLASAAVIPLVALAVAACGGGGAATAATPKTSSGAAATVGVANTSLGSILVNSTGRTVYLFKADVGHQERLHRRVRDRVAAAAGNRQADRRHRTDRLQARNDHPLGRQPAGHLQRPPALPVRQGPQSPARRPARA